MQEMTKEIEIKLKTKLSEAEKQIENKVAEITTLQTYLQTRT